MRRSMVGCAVVAMNWLVGAAETSAEEVLKVAEDIEKDLASFHGQEDKKASILKMIGDLRSDVEQCDKKKGEIESILRDVDPSLRSVSYDEYRERLGRRQSAIRRLLAGIKLDENSYFVSGNLDLQDGLLNAETIDRLMEDIEGARELAEEGSGEKLEARKSELRENIEGLKIYGSYLGRMKEADRLGVELEIAKERMEESLDRVEEQYSTLERHEEPPNEPSWSSTSEDEFSASVSRSSRSDSETEDGSDGSSPMSESTSDSEPGDGPPESEETC